MKNTALNLLIVLLLTNTGDALAQPEYSFDRLLSEEFNNLYRIDANLYRSEQPKRSGMNALSSLGIIRVINFRHKQTDRRKNERNQLELKHYPINTNRLNTEDIIYTLKYITDDPRPILLHCKHGSDRTGAIIAAYRVIIQDWTKEEALVELRDEKFGFHERWFPNIPELIQSLEVEKIREALDIDH